MQGVDRLNQYFTEQYKEDLKRKEKIETFMDDLRVDPIGITKTLVAETEKLYQDAQESGKLDTSIGSGSHNLLTGTVITKEMRVAQAQCVELFKQLEGVKIEAEKVYRSHVSKASYSMVAKEYKDNAKKLFQDVGQAMKLLKPYTQAHF